MPRIRVLVSVDTDTGEAVAAQITDEAANSIAVPPSFPRCVENYGADLCDAAAEDVVGEVLHLARAEQQHNTRWWRTFEPSNTRWWRTFEPSNKRA